MAYEIPQSLQYEEKFIAGLTFRQMICFLPLLLVGAGMFKTGLAMSVKIGVTGGVGMLCAACAFFRLEEKAFKLAKYYFREKRIGYLDKSMTDFVSVKTVEDDTIHMEDGKGIAVVQVFPINFAIRSEKEKESIIRNYQKFLNSIDFPLQVLVRTVELDLDSYLDHLRNIVKRKVESQKNKQLEVMFEDYCQHVAAYAEENKVKNRVFYLVIPSNPREENSLEIRTQLCMDGLAQCGLKTSRLTTNQLISMMANFFEGYIEADEDYDFPAIMQRGNHEKHEG